MRRTLQRRVRALEEQAPRSGPCGPLVAILPDGMSLEEFEATLQPWFTPLGEPRRPVIVMEDDRPSAPITFGAPKARPTYQSTEESKAPTLYLVADYDYGDDLEDDPT
jgi:hypothetical protein